ncbi:DUF952 domain-containing protein [Ferruginibacter sp. SUN002]|uniref:DUF952 domain-containing protein n=1 Tax=Ferruginibacter sp. SUN002 TaxID=2937789 RepID=UPI003D35CFB5
MIYHVVTDDEWQSAVAQGFYESPSLAIEGFIHTCTMEQLKGVLERYYKNKTNLLLLYIDETKLDAELKYELSPSIQEHFPHIYGQLNIDAVIKVTPIEQAL